MGLILKKSTGTATKAFNKSLKDYKDKDGKALPEKVRYDFSWYEYENEQSMVDAKDELTLEEQLKVRNVERKSKARQAANTACIDALGIKAPDMASDPQLRLKAVYSGLYANNIAEGMSEEDAKLDARKQAADWLKIEWADETE